MNILYNNIIGKGEIQMTRVRKLGSFLSFFLFIQECQLLETLISIMFLMLNNVSDPFKSFVR